LIAIVWQLDAKPNAIAEFERAYGPRGEWAELFARADGFVAVELQRDTVVAGRYLVVDRWQSAADADAFFVRWRREYDALDRRCEALTVHEQPLGRFEPVA
jgi:heme-degrading monooxygenase HmoA